MMLFLPCRIRVCGELKRRKGPLILVANHISHFDPPVLGVLVSQVIDFMAMKDLFSAGWSGWLFRNIFAIPVDREGSGTVALRLALQRLKDDRMIGIFPEGGLRTGDASILGKAVLPPGAALLSLKSGSPMVPVLILGTDQLYAKQAWWRRPVIRVEFLPEVKPPGGEGGDRDELNGEVDRALKRAYRDWKNGPDFREELVPRTAQQRWKEV